MYGYGYIVFENIVDLNNNVNFDVQMIRFSIHVEEHIGCVIFIHTIQVK